MCHGQPEEGDEVTPNWALWTKILNWGKKERKKEDRREAGC